MQNFGKQLKELRKGRGMSLRELGTRSGTPFTLISALENGSRRVGQYNATLIGKALRLTGTELQSFVFMAMDTSTQKVLKELEEYPAELINLLVGQLKAFGIPPDSIVSTISSSAGDGRIPHTRIHLKDGRSMDIDISIA